MEFERGVDPNAKLVRALSILVRRVHGVSTGKGTTAIRRLPSAPEAEGTGVSGRDTGARQRALIGDSLNDEQWSDDLPSHQTIMFQDRSAPGKKEKSTNLSFSEDR